MPEAIITADWNRLIVPNIAAEDLPLADEFLRETFTAYSNPERFYHDLLHILDCHQKLEPYQNREDYVKLWLAFLWHDEIYQTQPVKGNMSNERESAKLGYTRIDRLKLKGAYKVAQLIVATEYHNSTREDERLLNDIDMSVLAEPRNTYSAYSSGVRKEFGWVDDEHYRRGRVAALKGFARPIFRHPDFEHLNPLAEENIKAEIQELSAA